MENFSPPRWYGSDFLSDADELVCKEGHTIDRDGLWNIESAADEIAEALKQVNKSIKHFLAFVKTFDPCQFSTIYCEREWRSTQQFSFTLDDVAMIVLPRLGNTTCYFEAFVAAAEQELALPRSIPIVPWEDLVEH